MWPASNPDLFGVRVSLTFVMEILGLVDGGRPQLRLRRNGLVMTPNANGSVATVRVDPFACSTSLRSVVKVRLRRHSLTRMFCYSMDVLIARNGGRAGRIVVLRSRNDAIVPRLYQFLLHLLASFSAWRRLSKRNH